MTHPNSLICYKIQTSNGLIRYKIPTHLNSANCYVALLTLLNYPISPNSP